MLVSAVPGVAAAAAAYADLNGEIETIKAQISSLSSAQTSLTSTVSTLSTSSTCLLSKVNIIKLSTYDKPPYVFKHLKFWFQFFTLAG